MNQTLDFAALRRQAYRADAQDGLLEFFMGIVLFFVARAVVDPHLAWMRWMPAIMGGFCSGGFLYAAQRSGLPRHYFLFAVCIGWGVACSFLDVDTPYHGIRAWALGLGMLCLLMGISVFLNFLRTHPVPLPGAWR